MYFESRAAAGQKLADKLAQHYLNEPCVVVALNSGAVEVGLQVANRLNCPISMLITEEITLPREPTPIGGMTHSGVFSYNNQYSKAQLEEFIMEYHGVIEQNKLEKLHHMNRDMTSDELINPALIRDRNVILVSDGLSGGFILDLAMTYLKPIRYLDLVIATPFADIYAVDRMHIMADRIECLNVLENYISTNHYYDAKDALSRSDAIDITSRALRAWYSNQTLSYLEQIKRTKPRSGQRANLQPLSSTS